jgi:hypothetical protein
MMRVRIYASRGTEVCPTFRHLVSWLVASVRIWGCRGCVKNFIQGTPLFECVEKFFVCRTETITFIDAIGASRVGSIHILPLKISTVQTGGTSSASV